MKISYVIQLRLVSTTHLKKKYKPFRCRKLKWEVRPVFVHVRLAVIVLGTGHFPIQRHLGIPLKIH